MTGDVGDPQAMNEAEEFAQEAAEHGLPVFPFHPLLKKPLRNETEATTDKAVIAAWWKQWPDARVAVVFDEEYIVYSIGEEPAPLRSQDDIPEGTA